MSPSALLEIEEKTDDLIHLKSVEEVVDHIYALDVSKWDDENFAALEGAIDRLIRILSSAAIAQYRPQIERLLEARSGIEQGLPPDPEKRPTSEQMRAIVAAHLR